MVRKLKIIALAMIATAGCKSASKSDVMEDASEFRVYLALYEGLATANPVTGGAVPAAAESWETSPDGLTVTFYLRKNAKWSDGYPVTAQDFEFGIKRTIAPATAADYVSIVTDTVKGAAEFNAGRGRAEDVGIKALDDDTLQFTLTSPTDLFVEMSRHYAFAPVPRHAIKNFGKDWARPENIVTNGPLKLVPWTPPDRLIAEKNPLYWDADNVWLGKRPFLPINAAKTAYSMFKNGLLDDEMMDELALRDDF